MIEFELFEIRIDETMNEQIVVLKECHGDRMLPIVIGFFEAQAIQIKISDYELPRPLTHDLLASVIKALGAEVQHILVNKLEKNTFFARIVFNRNGDTLEIDSRPSDAIALAVRVGVPIFVNEEVISKVSDS
jgi:bifunctional DNase/RNase